MIGRGGRERLPTRVSRDLGVDQDGQVGSNVIKLSRHNTHATDLHVYHLPNDTIHKSSPLIVVHYGEDNRGKHTTGEDMIEVRGL